MTDISDDRKKSSSTVSDVEIINNIDDSDQSVTGKGVIIFLYLHHMIFGFFQRVAQVAEALVVAVALLRFHVIIMFMKMQTFSTKLKILLLPKIHWHFPQ